MSHVDDSLRLVNTGTKSLICVDGHMACSRSYTEFPLVVQHILKVDPTTLCGNYLILRQYVMVTHHRKSSMHDASYNGG